MTKRTPIILVALLAGGLVIFALNAYFPVPIEGWFASIGITIFLAGFGFAMLATARGIVILANPKTRSQTNIWTPIIVSIITVSIFYGVITMFVFVKQEAEKTQKQKEEPIPIIVQPDVRDIADQKNYVMLKLPYGLIIQNSDYPPGAPLFCLFDRDKKRIFKTRDVDVLLAELNKIPERTTIDMISKCTVPFYTEYGINIDEQYAQITAQLKHKQFVLVNSLEEDERHASFCYCEGGFTILDESKN